MKTGSFFSLVIILFLFTTACNDNSTPHVSAEMDDFLAMINGSYKDVSKALETYGAADEIKTHTMSMYDLKEGKVIAREKDCYTTEFSAGIVVRVYEICWKDGKIVRIQSEGIK